MGTGIKPGEGLPGGIIQSLLLSKETEILIKMIGKCLVLLCVAFGSSAASCLQVPQIQYQMRQSPLYFSSPLAQYSGNYYNGGYYGGNVVSSPVVATDGPEPAPLPVIQAPSITLPVVQGPVVALPSQPVPAPRVLSQRCICTKTVVKPQVIQRQVTVPRIQRYLKRTVTPIVENVSYKAKPISPQSAGAVSTATASGSQVSCSGNCYSRVC